MKISDILSEKNEIIRDGSFSSVGTLFTRFPRQIVYATRESDVEKITRNLSISCVITTPALIAGIPETLGVISSQNPQNTYYTLQSSLNSYPEFSLQSFITRISPSAKIHPSAVISSTSVDIGKDVIIEKNVIVNEHTIIDEGSIIRSNSIVGKIPPRPSSVTHYPEFQPPGGVHLHREVDVHANTRIYRAHFKGFTEIGNQTKIDNLSSVGAGASIGKRCLLCGGVIIGESVMIGDEGWIGPNTTLENQILIGNRVYITIGSTVTHDIDDDKVVYNNYAIDRKRFSKVMRGM